MAQGHMKRKRDNDDHEASWEKQPRRLTHRPINSTSKLPIKAAKQGWTAVDHDDDEDVESEEDEDIRELIDAPAPTPKPTWDDVNTAKEELARLAALVIENPEEYISSLKSMANIAKSENTAVVQLALAAQCSVFKDIIPGYSIRPLSQEEARAKVSNDIRKLRNFEQALVAHYHAYIKELQRVARAPQQTPQWAATRTATIVCASKLLLSVPHFNFRPELLKIVLNPLTRATAGRDYARCCQTIRTLFREDDSGRASFDVVQNLVKSMRAKEWDVHPSLLDLFLELRLLSEFSFKASHERIDKTGADQSGTYTAKKIRRINEKKQFKTKRNRKLEKEQKAIAKEFKEADALVGSEEREKLQAEILKLVFATYFRILKDNVSHLMGSVLEGLARYAHLINQDFFGDILEALKELITLSKHAEQDETDEATTHQQHVQERDSCRELLLCTVTAFALLQGQDGKSAMTALHLDLNFFVSNLFSTILPICLDADIELGPKSMRLDDPLAAASSQDFKVNAKTKSVLLVRCLSSTLLPAHALRSVPPMRIAAFAKQLMSAALQLPEKSCQALLGLLAQASKVHGSKISPLWHSEERRGDGVFSALKENAESSNPFAATVWETELLRLHYSPKITEALKIIQKTIMGIQ